MYQRSAHSDLLRSWAAHRSKVLSLESVRCPNIPSASSNDSTECFPSTASSTLITLSAVCPTYFHLHPGISTSAGTLSRRPIPAVTSELNLVIHDHVDDPGPVVLVISHSQELLAMPSHPHIQ